ncbi:phenylalanine--tRNA ligase subunit beta [Crocinitomix sp.]|nr:phenylalanine--tRNA ligase subunit beta [Crocinitomix sp.]
MKISYNWLKTYIKTDLSAEKVAEILTDTGLEVEGLEKVETIKGGLKGVVTGHVLSKTPHPDADRLNVTTVDVGSGELLQIVCGAPNVDTGQKVVVATVGTVLYPTPDEPLKIKKSKIRGVESSGMICAEDELGLGESHDGIMVLDNSTKIGIAAKDFFQIEDDYLIEIGLTPNRADAMGHIGVARDLKAFLNFHEDANLSLNWPKTEIPASGDESITFEIDDYSGAPRYAGAIISGITVAPSPDWLQNRLRSIGLNPINNIVDITNFVMHEYGNPLHAFDLADVNGKILVRRAKNGEKFVTLDEVERELDDQDLVIANGSEPMCMAGVFGGLHSGVKNATTAIFLEAAYFNPVSIRKSAKRQGLNTDSSFRFERGVDPNTIIESRNRAINLILEIAGGNLGKVYDNYPEKIEDFEVEFNFDRCRKLCGVAINDDVILTILRELDIEVISNSAGNAVLRVPPYRVDVQREADVIEEVLRIYGFNNIPLPEKLNTSITYQNRPNAEKIYTVTANLLADNGFSEIMNNSLTSSANWDKIKSETLKSQEDIHLLNPLSNELDVMRQTMLFGGLKSIEYNQNRQNRDLKLFEFGSVYKKVDGKYIERKKLAIWICGLKEAENWTNASEKSNFHTLKGAVEGVFVKLGINKAPRNSAIDHDLLADGYSISIANKNIATIGWVKPEVLREFGVKNTVYYAEFEWDTVIEISVMNKINFQIIPKTQFVRRDFSLLLDDSITFDSIQAIAKKVDRKILKEVGLFDVYEGKNLEKGKKSYAVSFIFQDNEKTLKDKQIDNIMSKIRKNVERELGAELR